MKKTLLTIVVPYEAYSHNCNAIVLVRALIADFLLYATDVEPGFGCVHEPEVIKFMENLVITADRLAADDYGDLEEMRQFLKDFAEISPHMWD